MYRRGDIWWASYVGPGGKRIRESTGETDRRRAERFERQRRAAVDAGTWQPLADEPGGVTVRGWAERWIARQHERGLSTSRDIETRVRLYILPELGARLVADLRPKDVRRFVEHLSTTDLSPRSVHHVYDCLRGMMRDAQIEELIIASPCVLPPGTLPKKRDADPRWRAGAVFTRSEIEQLISDERVPVDRRTYYALIFFAGMRHGEAAGRRWRDYDPAAVPLGSLTIATQVDAEGEDIETKTETPRVMPVHPTLAAILAEWRLGGFGELLGRSPRPDDWIVPSRRGRHRSVRHTLRRLHEDLERLGLRPRRTHDLRRSLVTLARADGARSDVLKVCTHGSGRDIVDLYTSWPWATLCEAVSCLRVSRLGRAAVGHTGRHIEATEAEKPLRLQGLSGRSGRDSKP